MSLSLHNTEPVSGSRERAAIERTSNPSDLTSKNVSNAKRASPDPHGSAGIRPRQACKFASKPLVVEKVQIRDQFSGLVLPPESAEVLIVDGWHPKTKNGGYRGGLFSLPLFVVGGACNPVRLFSPTNAVTRTAQKVLKYLLPKRRVVENEWRVAAEHDGKAKSTY